MNRLLTWMSAKGAGSLAGFRAQCAEIDGAVARRGSWAPHRLAAWNLAKLGHAEFAEAANGSGWRVAPPTLAASDIHGTVRAVLCGARPDGLINALSHRRDHIEVSVAAQDSGPDLIGIEARNAKSLSAMAKDLNLPLQWNASLAILAACSQVSRIPLEEHALLVGGGWTISRFSKSHLRWVDAAAAAVPSGRPQLFRFRGDYGTVHLLRAEGRAWACDPAVGKYRVLTRRQRPIHYYATTRELAVAASCRPPALVERALVVASGRLPSIRDNSLIYTRVELTTAQAAAAILGQRLY